MSAGPALYLMGNVFFRFRIARALSWVRVAGAAACVVVGLVGSIVPALYLSALLLGVLILVIPGETFDRAPAQAARAT